MAEVIERLDVTHNFVTIDSPIKFFIQMNEDTTHRVLKSAQAIQIDCRKLLTRKDMPNIPAWSLSIVYDDSLLAEGEKVNWYAHDVDFAGSTDSVNGVLVDVDLSALYAELNANNNALIDVIRPSVKVYDNISGTVLRNAFAEKFGENVWVNVPFENFCISQYASSVADLYRLWASHGYIRAKCENSRDSQAVSIQVSGLCCFVAGSTADGRFCPFFDFAIQPSSNYVYSLTDVFGLNL